MLSSLSYFCGLATLVFITTSLVVAAIRWFHMCRPYDRQPGYYYPGRPFVVGIYLNALVLLPYVLLPDSLDAWYLARLYFLPVTLFHFTLLLFSYFGNVMQWRQWRVQAVIAGLPVALALLVTLVPAVWPGDQIAEGGLVSPFAARCILYILGLVSTALCTVALVIVLRWARRFDEDDFSNPADFPVVSARKWMGLVLVNVVLCWVGALFDSRALLAVIMLLLATAAVVFIISILHPKRNRPVEEPETIADVPAAPLQAVPADQKHPDSHQVLLDAIHQVVVLQEAYQDPHLTIQDVADRIGYSRSYIAGIFKSEYGGFFTYVNKLRIASVEKYLQDNPDATVQEAAEVSGFVSRRAYYNVKSKMNQ